MLGTDIVVYKPATPIAGDVERRETVGTNASTDAELVAVWLELTGKQSRNTRIAYERIGGAFVAALATNGASLKSATVDDVQTAIQAIVTATNPETGDIRQRSAATVNTYTASVKSLLNFAHRVGYSRFNAAPLLRTRKGPAQRAKRIVSSVDVGVFIRSARTDRDRLMFEVAYYGGLRVSELTGITWGDLIPRDTGELQVAVTGKGDKERNVLLPADLSPRLAAMRGDAGNTDRVFPITPRRFNAIVKAAAKRAGINSDISAHWLRHAHASHSLDNGAPISLVSQTLGHASIKTTSIYSHARPNDSSSRYLKK